MVKANLGYVVAAYVHSVSTSREQYRASGVSRSVDVTSALPLYTPEEAGGYP
jgi:hypothetical protein